MNNVSIRTKLLVAFSALFLLIVAQGVFSINRLAVVNDLSTEMEENWLPSTRYVGAIKPRTETLPSAAALSGWPVAQVRAWGRPENLRILVLIPALSRLLLPTKG